MAWKEKYTAAVIGTGRIGFTLGFDLKREQPASHTMALLANRRIKLIAGCDSNAPRLAHWHRFNRKCAVFSDYSYLFATTKIDIAVVAVNEVSHMEVALAAIKAKPRLLILEKPVALNVAQAKRIMSESEKYKVPVLVNHERRFAEDYKVAKDYMRTIGEIQTINARLDSGLYVFNPEQEATGEYSLLHDGTHLVDIVNYLLEEKKSCASPERLLRKMKISGITKDRKNPRIVRNVNVHFESEKSRLYSGFYSLADDKTVSIPKKTRYFSNMVKNAVEFLDGKEPLRSTLQTSLNTLCTLEEIKNYLKFGD